MHDTRDHLRAWLREILEKSGETPTELARRAGVHSTTLTRFLSRPDAPTLSSTTVAKIAHAAGAVTPGPAGAPPPVVTARGLSDNDAVPYVANDQQNARDQAIQRLIAGRNSANAWVLRTDALVLAGYLPGDVVIVDLGATPVAGDVVCAQIYRWREAKADTVFRLFEPPYLVAASLAADLRKPAIVDNDRVIIKGVVTDTLRWRAPAE